MHHSSHSVTPEQESPHKVRKRFSPTNVFNLQGEEGSKEVAEQRIKGPVTLLSLSMIFQSDVGIVLSQLGAAHVRVQGKEGLVVEEEPASRCLQWTAVTLAPLTP